MDRGALERRLQREEEGLSEEERKQALQDMVDMYGRGGINAEGLQTATAADRATYATRMQTGAGRLQRFGLISPDRRTELGSKSLFRQETDDAKSWINRQLDAFGMGKVFKSTDSSLHSLGSGEPVNPEDLAPTDKMAFGIEQDLITRTNERRAQTQNRGAAGPESAPPEVLPAPAAPAAKAAPPEPPAVSQTNVQHHYHGFVFQGSPADQFAMHQRTMG